MISKHCLHSVLLGYQAKQWLYSSLMYIFYKSRIIFYMYTKSLWGLLRAFDNWGNLEAETLSTFIPGKFSSPSWPWNTTWFSWLQVTGKPIALFWGTLTIEIIIDMIHYLYQNVGKNMAKPEVSHSHNKSCHNAKKKKSNQNTEVKDLEWCSLQSCI